MKPDYHQLDEFQNRSQKLQEIRGYGVDPYPHKFHDCPSLESLLHFYEKDSSYHAEDAANGSSPEVKAFGRLVLFRAMGKNAFAQIQDDTTQLQLMFNRDHTQVEGLDTEKTGVKPLKFIEKKLDLGDIIGVEGHIFRTMKQEITIYVKKLTLLCKSLLPLPDKYSGLQDKGVRYHKRWLDLISNKESMHRLKTRSQILRLVRNHMEKADFLEVETPVLQSIYGGAEASPFITTLEAEHKKMYMRIALEISLKKLLVGGIPKVYEIGKIFRNEGIDKTHNPEFTMLEAYAASWDYHKMMDFVESLFEGIALKLFGKTAITVTDAKGSLTKIDFQRPWKRLTMKEAVRLFANIDVDALTEEELKKILQEQTDLPKEEIQDASKGSLIAMAFEEFAESHLIQPHHIIDHPIETTPFCKLHRDPKEKAEGIVERFETFIMATEMVNVYSELNDPEMQRDLLEKQQKARKDTVYPLDEDFIEAICQGMPPAAGVGIGIDRLVMLFTNALSIKDVLFFPL